MSGDNSPVTLMKWTEQEMPQSYETMNLYGEVSTRKATKFAKDEIGPITNDSQQNAC